MLADMPLDDFDRKIIAALQADGRLPNCEIAVVISSRSTVPGVERAEHAESPVEIIRTKDFPDVVRFSDQIAQAVQFGRF